MASSASAAVPNLQQPSLWPPPAPNLLGFQAAVSNGLSTAQEVPKKPSFAAMVARPAVVSRFPEIHLAPRQYGTKDGAPAITFSPAEYQAATRRLSHTLIAKFQIGRPPFEMVKQTFLASWKIKGRVTISSNWDDRHVVIILDSEEDVNEVLTNPLRRVGHTMFRLFRWTPDYNPKKESTTVTKWIRFPGLPMEMFDRAFLRSIVSSFAVFLDCDARTKEMDSLSFARACVELDVTRSVPSSVWINLPDDKGFFQEIVVEGGLRYCSKCKIHGHELATCRKAIKAGERKETTLVGNSKKEEILNQEFDKGVKMNAGNEHNTPVHEWKVVQKKRQKNKAKANVENAMFNGAESVMEVADSSSKECVKQQLEKISTNAVVREANNLKESEEKVQESANHVDGVIEKEEGEIIVESNKSQRKEVEAILRFASRVGVKTRVPDEVAIQILLSNLREKQGEGEMGRKGEYNQWRNTSVFLKRGERGVP